YLLAAGAACLLALAITAVLMVVPLLSSDMDGVAPEGESPGPVAGLQDLQVSTSIGSRVRYWRAAIDIVLTSPEIAFSSDRVHSLRRLIGYGPETFAVTFQSCCPEEMKSSYTASGVLLTRPHNHYLYLAATMGLLGLGSFLAIMLAFFCVWLRYLHKAPPGMYKLLLIGLLAGMSVYVVDCLFDPSTPAVELVFWSMLAFLPAIGRLARHEDHSEPALTSEEAIGQSSGGVGRRTRVKSLLALGCAVLLIAVGASLTIRPFLADMHLQNGLNFQAAQSRFAVLGFDKAVKTEPREPVYWSFLGTYAYTAALHVGDESLKAELLALSTSALEQARELDPYSAHYCSMAAHVYAYRAYEGDTDKWAVASSLYDRAAQLFPRNAVIMSDWALALAAKGDLEEAR
ncbi:MAG: O-antigen ligase family protein, partial [Dehalococcoidia bacterium]|nr:O-antigen ligase family protein [Dehalococcoidia bacterium]